MTSANDSATDREKIIDKAMKDFIAALPDDELFRADISKDKKSKFRSFKVSRIGKSP